MVFVCAASHRERFVWLIICLTKALSTPGERKLRTEVSDHPDYRNLNFAQLSAYVGQP